MGSVEHRGFLPPGEAVVLLHGLGEGRQAVTLALVGLVASGHLRLEAGAAPTQALQPPGVRLWVGTPLPDGASPPLLTLQQAVAAARGDLGALVVALMAAYGNTLEQAGTRLFAPALERQGLAQLRTRKLLGFSLGPSLDLTATGTALRERIRARLGQAWLLPSTLREPPEKAAALLDAVGPDLLLVPGLWQASPDLLSRLQERTRLATPPIASALCGDLTLLPLLGPALDWEISPATL